MNEEIKEYITKKCREMGMTQCDIYHGDALRFESISRTCMVKKGEKEGVYDFTFSDYTLKRPLMFKFPIPETYRGFVQVSNLLKIFHT